MLTTCNLEPGLAVPIPTFPLKYEVLLIAEKEPVISTDPVNCWVSEV